MAIAVDAQPAFAASSTTSVTSASFTPTAGSLLVACVGIANGNDIAGSGSSAITDTGSHSWTLLKRQANPAHATAEVWVADNSSTTAITVTATSQVASQVDMCLQVISFSGAAVAASQTGATAGANDSGTVSLTTTVTGSQAVGGYGFSSTVATLAAFNSATTIYGQNNGGAGDTDAAFKATSLTGTPGATTLGCAEGSLTTQAIAFAEILAAGSTAKALAETTTMTESLSLSRPAALTDTTAISDSVVHGTALADTITMADAATLAAAQALAEPVTLADSLTAPAPALADTTTLTDAASLVAAITPAADTTTLADSLTGPATALADTTTLTESTSLATAQALADSTALADSLKAPAPALADSTTMTDTSTLAVGSALADTATLTDILRAPTPALADTTTLTDSAALAAALSAQDTTTLADALTGPAIALADSTSLVDSTTLGTTPALADTTTLADSTTLAVGQTLTNATALADAVSLGVSPALADSTSMADSAALGAAQGLTDTTTLTDTAAVNTGGTQVAMSDATAVVDSLAAAPALAPTDTTSLADSLGLAAYVGDYAGSILPAGTTAPSVAGADTSVCLGEVFYLSSPRIVAGVQYYKADSTWDNTDIVVAVYTPSGGVVATATRTQQVSDPVGWVQVIFPHPAVLSLLGVGNQYTVAYRTGGTDTGHYAFATSYFASDFTRNSYTVPANGGRFKYVFGPAIDPPDHGVDTSYLVDVVSVPVNAGGDDSATLNDTLGIAAAQTLADSTSTTDSMTVLSGATPTLTDSTAVTDSLAIAVSRGVAEVTALSESLSIVVSVPMADATTLADSLSLVVVISAADTTASVDTLNVTANISQFDTVAVADSLTPLAKISQTDNVTVTDSAAFSAAFALSDRTTMTESIRAQTPKRLHSESLQDRPGAVSSTRTPRTETTRR